MADRQAEIDAPYRPDCLHLWDAHFDNRGQWIDCNGDRPKGHVCGADCLDLDSMRLPWRDRLALAWHDLRKRLRRCPECTRRGYGNTGAGPGRTYRWVDDPVVIACGFKTAPHRCNTCGQELSNWPAKPGTA